MYKIYFMPEKNQIQTKTSSKYTPEELQEVLKVHNYYVDLFRKWGKIQVENKKDSWLPKEFRLGGGFEEFIKLDEEGKTWYEKNVNEDGLGVWFDGGLFGGLFESLQIKEIIKTLAEESVKELELLKKDRQTQVFYWLWENRAEVFYKFVIYYLTILLFMDREIKNILFDYFDFKFIYTYIGDENDLIDSSVLENYLSEIKNDQILLLLLKSINKEISFKKIKDTVFLSYLLPQKEHLEQNPNFKIIIKNSDLGIQPVEVRQQLLELEKQGRAEFINCSWSGLPAVKQEQEVKTKPDNKAMFNFSNYIPKEYQDIFGDYFMGLKTFVEYAKGEKMNITISVNGGLFIEIEAENPNKMDTVLESFKDYFLNLVNLSQDQEPIINSIYPNPDRAFIFLQSKINSLDTQLQLRNSQFIKQQEKLLFLTQLVRNLKQEKHFLESKNQELESSIRILQKKIVDLNKQIENLNLANLEKSDQLIIELLLQNLAQLRLVIESKDPSIIKNTIKSVDEFYQKNQTKINLALAIIKQKDKILTSLEYILSELNNRF